MSDFAAPPFAVGPGTRFRISASEIARRSFPFTCPMGLALRARTRTGSLRIDPTSRRSRFDPSSALNFAVLRGARTVLEGADPRQALDAERDLTHSQRRFLGHVLDLIPDLLADAGDAAGASYRLGEDIAGRVDGDGIRGTVTAWGLHLTDAAGAAHEVVRLRFGALRVPDEDDRDWTASAAVALATDDATAPGARLRVSEFSLLDGALRCDFDGGRADAIRLFTERGRPLWNALQGSVFRPGAACADCPALGVCPAVASVPGLLGVGRGAASRKLSASDLASYARCATAYRALRADHLPDRFAPDADPAAAAAARDRGVGVHAWLAWAHSREPARACRAADLPDAGGAAGEAAARAAGLAADTYAAALPFLRQHVPLCPVGRPDLTGWQPEHRWVCHDPDADAVVITTPDLVYRVDGGDAAVWRETKTTRTVPADLATALRRYPDVALDVVALAAQAASSPDPSLVELEVLTATDATVLAVSTGDRAAAAEAAAVVAEIAGAFVTDTAFERNPGPACADCAAYGWCDPPSDRGRVR